ncbi:hypothetical protein MK851_13595 [Tenacibaculum sp. 1B UA]|uniref:hypothetical protein n=1 Tax=Tenacibaculum sp. 1B UA TaxID=2922252 RepID=UPI002A24D6E3|nr:hypothetical protein [Tenacibaculum sp. 1B UA]MDX8554652.1 hypothetical protein [Tenacibaculum sp. 1B UA]
MRTLTTICILLFGIFSNAQTSQEFIQELKTLRAEENAEKRKVEGESPNVRQAKLANISAKYQNLENKLRVKYNQIEQKAKQQEEYQNSLNQQQQEQRRANQQIYDQQVLTQMQQRQAQTQQLYQQEISNTLGNLSNSLQAAAYNNIKREIQRREKVATNFTRYNSGRIEKVKSLYNQIPSPNFDKNISGQFNAHLFLQRRYSFINNQELVTEIPCLVIVKNNKVVNIYPYGKKGFELEYPKLSASCLSNGIVKYTDFNTLESVTIVLLEPYLSDNPKQYSPLENGTGYITLYTSKRKDEGKTVWVQEINNKGNIVREVSTELVYAKKESELEEMNIKPIPFNTGNELYYFGEPVQTPYGTFPFFMKTSKSDTKELDDNEKRFVEIKKYRD